MTAVVRAEHATRTWLTGVTGLLIVAAAFVMMAWAAPAHASPHRHATSTSITALLESRVQAGAAHPRRSPAVRTLSEDRP